MKPGMQLTAEGEMAVSVEMVKLTDIGIYHVALGNQWKVSAKLI